MQGDYELKIVFRLPNKREYTLSLPGPRSDVSEPELMGVTNKIIAKHFFMLPGGIEPVGLKKAYTAVVTRQVIADNE